MVRRNILDYRNVLYLLNSSNKVAPDGCVTLYDIVIAFVHTTDKSKPETIMRHIEYLCQMRVLQKRGEITYRIAEDWKSILDRTR